MNDFKTYKSPFSWRYGSGEMRYIFSEENKYKIWRKIWVALARAQHKEGLVSHEELADLEKHQDQIDIEEILKNERETKHDVVAAIKEFADKTRTGGGKIHLGATSMDIVDNADALRAKKALSLIEKKLKNVLGLLAEKIEKYADMACLGYTHLQPAEPTTVGYRLSFYAQDLLTDYKYLQFVKETIKGKGMKGAVGTMASYKIILDEAGLTEKLEHEVMRELGIDAALISTQVAPRKYDYFVLSLLNSITSSLAKFAADLRILQTPAIGEWMEPFGTKQVGSSAMPFKQNPINAEKICSLARYVANLPNIALENASHSYLERTLDDSANKRIVMPEAFLAADEILITAEKIMQGMTFNEDRIKFNLQQYAPFAATEGIILETVKKGANRQEVHEILREISLQAWEEVKRGKTNPMMKLLVENEKLRKYMCNSEITKLLSIEGHVGNAPDRARKILEEIKNI